MKKTVRTKIFAMALTGAMLLSLAACGAGKGMSTEEASECVQVELDTTYKGQFQGFVDFYSNVTTDDAKSQYDANVEGEAYAFLYGLGPQALDDSGDSVEPTEMQLHEVKELYKKIYAKADYTVVSSTKQDDGTFAVKVTIRPLDILHLVSDGIEEGFAGFWEKFEAVDTESMSDEEFESWYVDPFAKEYYDTALDLLESKIDEMGYMDEKSIVIQVQQSEDGSLYFSDEDWVNLDNLIIDYNF